MDIDIEKRIHESISDLDFEKYLGKAVSKKIFKYADLENFSFAKLLPRKRDYAIILIENHENNGHWTVLTKDYDKRLVTWFDSYGIRPSGELKWISASQNQKLDNQPYDLLNILNEANRKGYSVVYNKKRFQSSDYKVATCGRHCIFFITCFLKYHMDLYDYIYNMELLEKEYNTDSDHIVAQFII